MKQILLKGVEKCVIKIVRMSSKGEKLFKKKNTFLTLKEGLTKDYR